MIDGKKNVEGRYANLGSTTTYTTVIYAVSKVIVFIGAMENMFILLLLL